jgi:hypothetical protein
MIQRLIIMTSTFMMDLINTLNLLGITLILSTACTPAPNTSQTPEQINRSDSDLIAPPDMEEEWSYYQGSDFYLETSHTNVIRQILFLQEETPGIVSGFNLDRRVSERGDEESCGHPDREDPEGRSGIDNQFATLFRLLSVIVEDTPQVAIQGAINEGRVLMMVELLGVDSLVDDDDVTLRIFRASGRPLIGNQGLIAPYQTFYRDDQFPISEVQGIQIHNGELQAGPVDFEIPIDVLDANFPMTVLNGQIRMTLNEDGSFSGLIGGSINVDQVLDEFAIVVSGNEDDLARPIFKANADMGYVDGECQEISLAFEVNGHIAYAVHRKERGSETE